MTAMSGRKARGKSVIEPSPHGFLSQETHHVGKIDVLGSGGVHLMRSKPSISRSSLWKTDWIFAVTAGRKSASVLAYKITRICPLPLEGDATSADIRQTAIFDPMGVGGQLYWYALSPLHRLLFAGMLRGIGRASADEPVGQPQTPARGGV
jgi:hypothetical protein